MSDENKALKLGIEVETGQAIPAIKQVADETAKVTSASVQGAEKTVAADAKAFASKKQLKDMVKQLGHEIPILGTLGHLAMNKVALATAGITAAYVIWNAKVKEIVSTYASFSLPDLSPPDPNKINASVAAWKGYLEALKEIAEQSRSIEVSTANALSQINATAAMLKKMREAEAKASADKQAPGGAGADAFFQREAARATYQTEMQAAAELEARGKAKAEKAADIVLGTTEQDKAGIEEANKQAAAAKEAQKKTQRNVDDIREYKAWREGSSVGDFAGRVRVEARKAATGLSMEELLAIDEAQLGSQNAVIANARNREKGFPEREARRKAREENYKGSAADIAAAAAKRAEAERRYREEEVRYAFERSQAGLPVTVTPTGAGGSVTPEAAAELRRIKELNAEILNLWIRDREAWLREMQKGMPGKTAPAMN